MSRRLRLVDPADVARLARVPVDAETLQQAGVIVEDVRENGETALRDHSLRFGDLAPEEGLTVSRSQLDRALAEIDGEQRELLERASDRIRRFAQAQRSAVVDVDIDVVGGRAGHRWIPAETVGAYAPGGRHPLPSTVLMTVIPARVAGVAHVTVASPKPTRLTMAAAALAGADRLLRVGGAQAIAALAFGIGCPPSDLVVGPGNKWVTAAKKHLYGEVGIDGLAGPSEIVVVSDTDADPGLIAADLIAQAEHDPDATPILVTTDRGMSDRVETQVTAQLADLETRSVAARAMGNGFCVIVADLDQAVEVSDRIAPEHLALHVTHPETWARRFASYGSLFVGSASAEAFADYGVGPNHVLPTGGGARHQAGLSVLTYLRSPTWLHLTDARPLTSDTAGFARLEGLEGHARAAEARNPIRR